MPAESHIRDSTSRVLVIFPGALGDLICLLPTLRAIARRSPGASIELMARAELARFAAARIAFADRDPAGHSRARSLSRAHSIDRREVSALFSESSDGVAGARGFFGPFERIYSFFAYDDACFRATLAASTDGTVSFHRFRPDRENVDENLDDAHRDSHVAAAYLRSIGERDAAIGAHEARIEPTPDDLDAATRALAEAGCERSNPILIFPGSGSARKNWPADKFATLAARLVGEMPGAQVAIAIILGPAEAGLEQIFATTRSERICVLGNLPLGTVAGLARMASGFVGNDSGVSHLAAAAGAPGVAIFGPTDPSRWRPLGPVDVVRREPIESIEPDEIIAALRRVLIDSGAERPA